MTEYIVFPLPKGLVTMSASNVKVARNKYRKAKPEMDDYELVVVPAAFAQKTSIDLIFPIHKCNIEEVK